MLPTLSSFVQSGGLTRWVPGVDNRQTDSVRWPYRSQGWATRGRGARPGPCPVPVDAICPSTDGKEPWDSSHLVPGMDHCSIPGCGKLLPAVLTPGLCPEHPRLHPVGRMDKKRQEWEPWPCIISSMASYTRAPGARRWLAPHPTALSKHRVTAPCTPPLKGSPH